MATIPSPDELARRVRSLEAERQRPIPPRPPLPHTPLTGPQVVTR